MFKNYFKTAIRNLKRNKGFALINILGLAVGIAACFLIFLVIQFETSFDTFHSKKEQIYRVASKFTTQDGVDYSAGSSFPVGPGLRIDFPQLKGVARIFREGNEQITLEDGKKKFQEDVYYAEPEFFDLFDFVWLSGDAKTALTQPASAVLTREIAEKYFGDWHAAIGKTIKYDNDPTQIYKISGILENPPANTDFPLSIVVSYSTMGAMSNKERLDDWVSTFGSAYTFVILPENYSLDKFNTELAAFGKRHKPAEYASDSYTAQPLLEMHSDDRFDNYGRHFFSKSLVTALTLIGIFLILIACMNFINLATAQAVNRSKEVGVRKVLGSNRKQLAFQYFGETALITGVSIFAAILIVIAVLPFLNTLLELKMTLSSINIFLLTGFLLVVFLLVTLLSGLYPALVLSGFNPITALKSKVSVSTVGNTALRRGLVVFQFVIAHILIIGTLVIVSQMNFIRNASLGFDKAAIITVPIPNDSISQTRHNYLHARLAQNPGIKNVSFSFSSPSSNGNWNSDFKFDHAEKSTNFSANLKWADVDYFSTYGLYFVAGRPYHPSDTVREFVVNETLLKKLGITDPQKAIGKQLDFWDGKKVGPIVGVVRDFNSYSLRDPMAAVALSTWKDVYRTINIKIKPGEEKSVLAMVEKEWNAAFPDFIYQYNFLDETIKDFYKHENQLSQLYKIFAAIAIFISCLGLYGLVSFMVVQRTKEVGIRKVLGADVTNIIYLLSKEFTILILVAFAIGGVAAYYIMQEWLQNYTYRIQVSVSIFLVALISSIAIAWLTVGRHAIKAALANPVKSLRTE